LRTELGDLVVPQIRLWKPPVEEAGLVDAALAGIGRGATWVKVIADFPDLAARTDARGYYHATWPLSTGRASRDATVCSSAAMTGWSVSPAGIAQKMQSITPARYAAGNS
jgi:hypothetical protein